MIHSRLIAERNRRFLILQMSIKVMLKFKKNMMELVANMLSLC